MRIRNVIPGLSATCLLLSSSTGAQNTLTSRAPVVAQVNAPPVLPTTVDWARFLAQHDMVWNRLPQGYHEGPFIGNGLVGAMIFQKENTLSWELGRTDVFDHRPTDKPDFNTLTYLHSRLPIGRFLLNPVGNITGCSLRLDLWNAELRGTVTTDKGTIAIRSYAHASDPIIVCEMTPSEGENGATWDWHGDKSISPRFHPRKLPPAGYGPNPDPVDLENKGVHVHAQPMIAGGEYATAWRELKNNQTKTLVASIAYNQKDASSRDHAAQDVARFAVRPLETNLASHRAWWHGFYPRHFVSLSDTPVESFYWIQMYKLGAATRPDRPAMDLLGPWFRPTQWPGFWWNINTQVAYYPLYASNHIDFVEPLLAMTEANRDNLALNARGVPNAYALGRMTSLDMRGVIEKETGDLPWVLHHFWQSFQYTQDERYLRRLFPLLKGSFNFYASLLEEGADGKLHLPSSISPEYGESRDTNYDLSWLRWEATTLLQTNTRLGLKDADAAKWQTTLDRLTPYPRDERGFRIGADLSMERAHHHYSHLMMVYPTRMMTGETPEERALMKRSLDNWRQVGGWGEFSRPAAVAMSTMLGDTSHVRGDIIDQIKECDPNTMHNGKESPVLDGGPGVVTAVNEALLGSWGGVMRVFPAAPQEWPDISFARMRAEGGFEVSAVRRAGKTRFIVVTSLAGQPLRLRCDLSGLVFAQPLNNRANKPARELRPGPDGTLDVPLDKGESIVLFSGPTRPNLEISPVDADPKGINRFGLP